jgi:cytochrome P450
MAKYFEFTTSDIISDFCFAESYGQLESGKQEPAIEALHKFIPLDAKLTIFPRVLQLIFFIRILGIAQMKMLARAEEQVKTRLEKKTETKDMMKHVMKHMSEDGDGLSMEELGRNALILMLAGSETTATTLSGAIFYVLRNQNVTKQLTSELRGAFETKEDITIAKVLTITPT